MKKLMKQSVLLFFIVSVLGFLLGLFFKLKFGVYAMDLLYVTILSLIVGFVGAISFYYMINYADNL